MAFIDTIDDRDIDAEVSKPTPRFRRTLQERTLTTYGEFHIVRMRFNVS